MFNPARTWPRIRRCEFNPITRLHSPDGVALRDGAADGSRFGDGLLAEGLGVSVVRLGEDLLAAAVVHGGVLDDVAIFHVNHPTGLHRHIHFVRDQDNGDPLGV